MNDPFSLEAKKIVITGASSGIGRSVAIECSRKGASLLLIARNEERLKETLSLLSPGDHRFCSVDITDYDKLDPIIADYVGSYSKIDGLIHAAGMSMTIPFGMIRPENYQQLFSVNAVAGFELARILVKKHYVDSEKGASFVFISSIHALFGLEGAVPYCASKGALSAGVKAMALELAARKIRVNAILPAYVHTEMTENLFDSIPEESKQKLIAAHPLGIGEPEDVAYACIFLLSDAGKWISGTDLILDGGYSAR
jgi:NAD(P)-dependent dehydrogenase (short-subunit alcohol dehydrogenase family)